MLVMCPWCCMPFSFLVQACPLLYHQTIICLSICQTVSSIWLLVKLQWTFAGKSCSHIFIFLKLFRSAIAGLWIRWICSFFRTCQTVWERNYTCLHCPQRCVVQTLTNIWWYPSFSNFSLYIRWVEVSLAAIIWFPSKDTCNWIRNLH